MAFCSNCGKEFIGDPDMCVNCGVVLKKDKTSQYHSPQYHTPQTHAPQYQAPQYPQQPYPQQQYPQQQYPQQQFHNPQYPSNQYGAAGYGVSDKQKMIVALLAFLLGTVGVHRFYTGKIGTGIAMAVLTVIGWITSIFVVGYFIVMAIGLWALIDFIMILMGKFTDKYGRPIVN
ncbi:MAG: TM2 domain-containing protein [Dehalococcoidales bacterium]|nr:TM2 domain-containing protein [Dehalococcoidales bacterium]